MKIQPWYTLIILIILFSCTPQPSTKIIATARPHTDVEVYHDVRISIVYTATVVKTVDWYDDHVSVAMHYHDTGEIQPRWMRKKYKVTRYFTNVTFEYLLCGPFTGKWIKSRTVYEGSTDAGNFKPRSTDYLGCGAPWEMWCYRDINNDPLGMWKAIEGKPPMITMQDFLNLRHRAEQVAIKEIQTNSRIWSVVK